jgi:hypothetical protein
MIGPGPVAYRCIRRRDNKPCQAPDATAPGLLGLPGVTDGLSAHRRDMFLAYSRPTLLPTEGTSTTGSFSNRTRRPVPWWFKGLTQLRGR